MSEPLPPQVSKLEIENGSEKPSSKETKPSSRSFKDTVESITESLPVTIIMSILTIWALLSDDIRLSGTSTNADEGFTVLISIAFFLFFAELFAGCIYKDGYLHLPSFTEVPGETYSQKMERLFNFGSFYFWLDFIATVSLIFEVCCFMVGLPLTFFCRCTGSLATV